MSEPIKAADVLGSWNASHQVRYPYEPSEDHDPIAELRRACGWDGEGVPPDLAIRHDGTLAVAAWAGTFRIAESGYVPVPIDASGSTTLFDLVPVDDE